MHPKIPAPDYDVPTRLPWNNMQRSDSKSSPERQLQHHDDSRNNKKDFKRSPERQLEHYDVSRNNKKDSKRSPERQLERQDSHRMAERSDSSDSPKLHRNNSQKERYQNAVDTIQNHVEAYKDRPPVTKNLFLYRADPRVRKISDHHRNLHGQPKGPQSLLESIRSVELHSHDANRSPYHQPWLVRSSPERHSHMERPGSYQQWMVRSSPERQSERPGSYQQWMARSTPERQSKIGPPVMPKPKLYRDSSFNGHHHHHAGHREDYYPDHHGGPYVISGHPERHGDLNAGFNHHPELDLQPVQHNSYMHNSEPVPQITDKMPLKPVHMICSNCRTGIQTQLKTKGILCSKKGSHYCPICKAYIGCTF